MNVRAFLSCSVVYSGFSTTPRVTSRDHNPCMSSSTGNALHPLDRESGACRTRGEGGDSGTTQPGPDAPPCRGMSESGAAPCNKSREQLEINLEHSMDGDDVYVALFKRSGGVDVCKKCGQPVSQHAARSPPPLTSLPQQPWARAQRLDTLDAVRAAA